MKKQQPEQNIVGKNIRAFRVKHGDTQEKLGEIIGYSATTVANYESGYRLPDILTAYEITKYYGISLEDLLTSQNNSG